MTATMGSHVADLDRLCRMSFTKRMHKLKSASDAQSSHTLNEVTHEDEANIVIKIRIAVVHTMCIHSAKLPQ
jgi:hypothetical protein